MDKIESVDSPSLQLYLKIVVNLLGATDGSPEAQKSKKQAFMPVISRLVPSLAKVGVC